MQIETRLLIAREMVDGAGEPVPVLDPCTGEAICEVAEASADQVDAAVRAAVEAFPTYSRTTPAQRSALMLELAGRLEAELESFAALEALDTGKPIGGAREEMVACVDLLRFMAGACFWRGVTSGPPI